MDAQAKQQTVDRVKQASNVLVTVSNNPSVDQLTACIGLTLLLNKMQKHGTAVFSGKVPSTIEFLQPEKTLETNTDSLRDFIISLDKNKADKLRYKVEDNVVRIFITPYRTSLSEKDLIFSQGDFNVDLVIALGVHDRTQVDAAITAHGRILHDATVIGLAAGQGKVPDLGQINWQDPAASSLCEMLVSISEAFAPGLIDNQIATAFLTGIVAETQRFSNPRTSPKTMTMAAQLMAAGANQQLIVSKLEPPAPPPPPPPPAPPAAPPAPRQPKPSAPKPPEPKPPKKDGTLNVSHDKGKQTEEEIEIAPGEIHIDEKGNIKTAEELEAERKKRQQEAGMPAMMTAEPETEAERPQPTPVPAAEPAATVLPEPPPPAPAPEPAPAPAPAPPPPPAPPEPQPLPIAPVNPPTSQPHPHELLADRRPAFSSAFTADTQSEWVNPYDTVQMDPLVGHEGPQPHGVVSTSEHERVVQPPADFKPSATPVLDNARSAVQMAAAANPAEILPPVTALNAMPVGPELHQNATVAPSLPLPGAPAPQVIGPQMAAPASDIAPAAPPAVPPPLPQVVGMTPTVVSPTTAAPTPAGPLF